MSLIDRRFQLADAPASLGLNCTPDGVTLAGSPLLRMTVSGLAPRSTNNLNILLQAAYGRYLDPEALSRGLTVVAKALNDGDLGRAMVASVRLRLPALDAAAGVRVAEANATLLKAYNEQEPRDWRGRWTTGGAGAGKPSKPSRSKPPSPARRVPAPRPGLAAVVAPARTVVLQTAAAGVPPRAAVWQAFKALYPNFQSQFDDLGPVEFAKRVIKFSEWVEAQTHANRPFDRAGAKAEYYFLQNRLEFWLPYPHKSQRAYLNLISAASFLFIGATNAGLIRQGDSDSFPRSWEQVNLLAMTLDGSANGRGLPSRSRPVAPPPEPIAQMPWLAEPLSGIGGVVSNRAVSIVWGGGIEEQGYPWERYVASTLPSRYLYTPHSMAVDHFDPDTGHAISSKTLDTTLFSRVNRPSVIFKKISAYIRDIANYQAGSAKRDWDIPPEWIKSREIKLAIPENTSPEQWRQINLARQLAESKGIRLDVTMIRDDEDF